MLTRRPLAQGSSSVTERERRDDKSPRRGLCRGLLHIGVLAQDGDGVSLFA